MKKKRFWILGILLAAYTLIVAVDCSRLNCAETARKPLITLQSEESEYRKRYTGLGYTVQYYVDEAAKEAVQDATGAETENVNGAEFRLLDTFLIWGWQI